VFSNGFMVGKRLEKVSNVQSLLCKNLLKLRRFGTLHAQIPSNTLRAVFDFRTTGTFVHYKFSPLIRLSYTADEKKKTFRTAKLSLELYFVYTNCQKGRSHCPRSLRRGCSAARLLGLNSTRGMYACLISIFQFARL